MHRAARKRESRIGQQLQMRMRIGNRPLELRRIHHPVLPVFALLSKERVVEHGLLSLVDHRHLLHIQIDCICVETREQRVARLHRVASG